MARRRKRRFGYIRLRNRGAKIARRIDVEEQDPHGRRKVRKVGFNVFVQRGDLVTDYGRKHGYWAWACTSKHVSSGISRSIPGLADKRRKTCGEEMWGRTPTAAVKRALVILGKKKELR